jgi:16S rRNA processing protein RimM
MHVALVPPQLKRDRFHTVLDASEGDAGQLVALSGSRSMTDAESLVGSYVLALMDELPEQVELMDDSWLEGREVVDETRGSLGHIVEVLRGPANDAWVIQGPEGEVIIPVVDHLLVDVPDEGPILVSARPEDMVRG